MEMVKFAGIYSGIVLVGFFGGCLAAWVTITIGVAFLDGWVYLFGNSSASRAAQILTMVFVAMLTFIQSIKD